MHGQQYSRWVEVLVQVCTDLISENTQEKTPETTSWLAVAVVASVYVPPCALANTNIMMLQVQVQTVVVVPSLVRFVAPQKKIKFEQDQQIAKTHTAYFCSVSVCLYGVVCMPVNHIERLIIATHQYIQISYPRCSYNSTCCMTKQVTSQGRSGDNIIFTVRPAFRRRNGPVKSTKTIARSCSS